MIISSKNCLPFQIWHTSALIRDARSGTQITCWAWCCYIHFRWKQHRHIQVSLINRTCQFIKFLDVWLLAICSTKIVCDLQLPQHQTYLLTCFIYDVRPQFMSDLDQSGLTCWFDRRYIWTPGWERLGQTCTNHTIIKIFMVNGTNYMLLGIHNGDQTGTKLMLWCYFDGFYKECTLGMLIFVFIFGTLNEAQCSGL